MAWHELLGDLRRHILASLGVAPSLLLACSGAPAGEDDAGVTTDPSEGGSSSLDDGSSSSSSSSSSGMSSSGFETTGEPNPTDDDDDDGDGDGDDSPRLDLPPQPDLPPAPPGMCSVTETPTSTLDRYPECPITFEDHGWCWGNLYWGCVEHEPGASCDELCPDGDCVEDWTSCSGDPVFDMPSDVCGPYEIGDRCCSLARIILGCADGRPFVVAGAAREASLASPGWSSAGEANTTPREQLAARWAAVARAEHASIASFAQFCARLLALGAPPSLVRDALAAAGDEVRHAEFALAVASELSGRPLEFGPLEVRGSNTGESLAATVLACVREGCIGETLSALELGAAALACSDPERAAALRAIADDEARHAALAWAFVGWALRRAPGLVAAVAGEFAGALAGSVSASEDEHLDASERELLRAHGWLSAAERRRLRAEGLRELVTPCARALVAGIESDLTTNTRAGIRRPSCL
jgi:hypothetical protein